MVRDSNGQWFESRQHFCGKLSIYRRQHQRMEQLRKELSETDDPKLNPAEDSQPIHFKTLDAINAADSLEEAKDQLLLLGFNPMK